MHPSTEQALSPFTTTKKTKGMPQIQLPSYDTGTDFVPEDQVALIHRGEQVIPAEENPNAAMKPLGTPQSKPGIGRIEPTTADSTETQVIARGTPEERAAIKVDKQKAMGSGDLIALGKAAIAERHLELSTSDVAGPIAERPTAGLPKIALPQEEHQDTAGGPLISGAPTSETPSEQRDLRNMDRKAQADRLEQQRQTALANHDQTTADRLALAKAQLEKTPWADRSLLGKIGHVAGTVGNIAGDIVAPGLMEITPGTALNRAIKQGSAYGRIATDTANDLREAQANAKEEPKEATLHELSGGAVDPQHPELGRQQALYNEKTGEVSYKGPAKPEKLAASEMQANDTQIAEATTQLPAITRALTPDERKAFAFPTGYKPSVAEIKANNELASKANAEKLAGNRDALEQTKQDAADAKLKKQDTLNEQIANDIAPMDAHSLSRLKDITSMRSEDREDVYARAHKLNPDFNTAEVDRRVKMLDNFTNGKDAQNIQSFGTFFEHAGNASQIVNDLRNGATPKIVNVAINKLEKEGWGTTATQISAALEPVRKEFEGFLLGGRALYADDRKAAETILSDASTPAQVQAALKVLAHTAGARYNEMNNRFKNTMKVNIDEGAGPLAPEAYDAAGHLGIKEMGGMELKSRSQGYGWYPKEK